MDSIPALVVDNGEVTIGEDAILQQLRFVVPDAGDADAHRQKAEKARRRYLEEECECSHAATR